MILDCRDIFRIKCSPKVEGKWNLICRIYDHSFILKNDFIKLHILIICIYQLLF